MGYRYEVEVALPPRRQRGAPPPPDGTPPSAPASDRGEMEVETED